LSSPTSLSVLMSFPIMAVVVLIVSMRILPVLRYGYQKI
jgi:hypothetical protein